MSLRKTAASGATWTALSAITSAVTQFAQLLVLARLLSPHDFGLLAIAALVVSFAQAYADVGISAAIVQRQDATTEELSSLYWLNVFAGIVLFGVALSAAPLIAGLYHEPVLFPIIAWTCGSFLIAPAGQQFLYLLQKTSRFRELAIIDVASNIVGTIAAIWAAYRGWGPFALVAGRLLTTFVATVFYVALGWRRWTPLLRLRYGDVRSYLSFGFYQMGDRSANFIYARIDQIFISLLLGTVALGYYTVAWNLVMQPITRINPILTRVAFPLFSRVQDDNARLSRGYFSLVRVLAVTNTPILIGCAAVAPLLVPALYGQKWSPAVPLVQILAFVGLLRTFMNPMGFLLLAKGRADIGFRWTVGVVIAQIPFSYLGTKYFGVEGAALAILLVHVGCLAVFHTLIIGPLLECRIGQLIGSLLPAILAAGAMAIAVSLLPQFLRAPPNVILGSQILLGFVIYTFTMLLWQRELFDEVRLLISRQK